mmetsp:Transcript_6300/g.11984  ORF Transcript_6300/g.11984 Transcript_6300/m.11984 type:complete len:175 (+) Transcript_6300:587-1111(+)
MQIHRDDTIDTHAFEQTCNICSRNGYSCSHLAILTGVAVVRDHGSNAASRGASHGGYHKQELHKVLVYGATRGLDDVYILATYVFMHHNIHLSICKARYGDSTESYAQMLYDLLCKIFVGIATEDLHARVLRVLLRLTRCSWRSFAVCKCHTGADAANCHEEGYRGNSSMTLCT